MAKPYGQDFGPGNGILSLIIDLPRISMAEPYAENFDSENGIPSRLIDLPLMGVL
jgi:hypothetical protein